MERVETLLKKINDLFAEGASAEQLLLATQMLQAELHHLQNLTNTNSFGNISISILPNNKDFTVKKEELLVIVESEKTIEIEAELEEIKRNAEKFQQISVKNKPQLIFEEDTETIQPTFIETKKEINEQITSTPSVNDKLKQAKIDLGDTLTEVPIRELKKAIGINDRFLFINELFRGDEAMYERSIKTINGFSILAEAEYWIQRELKTKIGWNDKLEVVQQFNQLIKRRFS